LTVDALGRDCPNALLRKSFVPMLPEECLASIAGGRLPMSHLVYSAKWFGVVILGLMTLSVRAEEQQPLERVATIPLQGKAGALDHMAADWKGSRLFVSNQSNDTLDVVDVNDGKLVKQVLGQKQIHGIAYAADLDRIFVGNGEGVCNAIDGKNYTVLKSIPVPDADSVRYDSRTHRVYVASQKSLAVIDANSLELFSTVKLPASPHGFQVATKHPRVYVNSGVPCEVSVVDADKGEVIAHYPLGEHKGIGPLTLDEVNQRILVGLRREPRFAVLELESGKECASLPIPEVSDDMALDAETKRIYISCNSGFVAVIRQIDADHYESLANVPTIRGAKTSAYDPVSKRLYVAVPRQAGRERPEVWVYQARR
jgi:DNA-binding beta-propeller fold protein YncE